MHAWLRVNACVSEEEDRLRWQDWEVNNGGGGVEGGRIRVGGRRVSV